MNDDFQHLPPPPPDEADDPLLQALRQHLGVGFGQEPPARLWAGIRQQLPAVPKPWWRRPRRLLPLLLLLLIGTVAVWQLGWRRLGSGHGAYPAANGTRMGTQPLGAPASSSSVAATRRATRSSTAGIRGVAASSTTVAPAVGRPALAAGTERTLTASGSRPQALAGAPANTALAYPAANAASGRTAAVARVRSARHAAALAEASAAAYRRGQRHSVRGVAGSAATIATLLPRPGTKRPARAIQATANGYAAAAPRAQEGAWQPAAKASRLRTAQQQEATKKAAQLASAASLSEALTGRRADQNQLPAYPLAAPSFAPDGLSASRATPLAPLSLRLPSYRPGLPGLPDPLAETDLSPSPWLPPSRRWAVQVLAGPTLSYRSIRQASSGGLAYATPNPTANIPTYSPSLPDTTNRTGLERAALGWGAQVQARRVLSGRWALGAGLGYHEYATYLSLDVTTRAYNSLSSSVVASTLAVRQRDTYRVLTLPVQLSYALAPPRSRLALGVLGGLEPSLYLGGRSTERSSCACEQQEFTSAANSPYNTLSLALSLGLDMRYHLGGPTSGWTLLVQPTGRYVASTFVRNPGWGYVLRQPYSLGLMTGVAWEW